MKLVLKKYIPDFSVAFTVIVLLASITNLIRGEMRNGYILFILEAALYLMIAVSIDYVLGMVDYKSYLSQFLVEAGLLYPVTIGGGLLLHWFSYSVMNCVLYSFIYFVLMVLLHIYFYKVSKKDAEEINELIRCREE